MKKRNSLTSEWNLGVALDIGFVEGLGLEPSTEMVSGESSCSSSGPIHQLLLMGSQGTFDVVDQRPRVWTYCPKDTSASSSVCHVSRAAVNRRGPPRYLPTGVARETIEIEMGKRRLLPRGHEKKPTKRTGKNRRGFSKTGLAKYLKADSHLYAPLVARSPSDPSPSETLQSFDEEVKVGRPSKVKEKRLLERIVEYLKSDSYMYAPLIDVDSISPAPASGLHHQVEKVTVAASRTAMTVKEITGRQLPEGSVPESSVPEHLGLGHRKTMKHTVYRNCRTSSSSGTESMSRELRRLVG